MLLTELTLSEEFYRATEGWNWEVEGFIDKSGYVYPIDRDTKVLSTVFERLSSPVLRSIAKKYGYVVETANQTTYPDFTMSKFDGLSLIHRIAIDIKSTYFSSAMGFTLGGYNSFLRNGTKNILHPYSTYSDHWIIGFIYKQNTAFKEYDLDSMPLHGQIACPYRDVYVFIRQKYHISGLRAGSGNTKNIGSIKLRDQNLFSSELGPFSKFSRGREACDFYWKNYEIYAAEVRTESDLLDHAHFREYL
jgi:hypothetical protein